MKNTSDKNTPRKNANNKRPVDTRSSRSSSLGDRSSKERRPVIEPRVPVIDARLSAMRMLRLILGKGQSFDQAQLQLRDELNQLEDRDRAFARAIVLNSLRHLGQVDHLIKQYMDRAIRDDQGMTLYVLCVGLVQLMFMGTPPHAAIGEMLSLLDKKTEFAPCRKYKGLVNAILGRADREARELIVDQNAAKLNTPEWLWDSWVKDFDEPTAQAMAEANLIEAPIDIMARDLNENEVLDDAQQMPSGSQRLPSGYDLLSLPGFADGRWWVQDIASSLPLKYASELVNGFDQKTVIDLCAAPGGKTMQLAAAGAKVTAVDISNKRLVRLQENMDRLGFDADIQAADASKWRPENLADFVFLDAPCSATGTMRRHPDLAHTKWQEDVDKLSETQKRLMTAAWEMVKPGGYLLYAVCSLQKQEAEEQFSNFTSITEDASHVPFEKNAIAGLEECISGEGYLRCRPDILSDEGGMDGFFAGLLQKSS